MKKILIAGGSGFVGTHLTSFLSKRGDEVYILSTQKSTKKNTFYWNPKAKFIDTIEHDFEAVINLCGANIGDKYWTQSRKQELIDSRIDSTRFLKQLIDQGIIKSNYFIQTSAIGFYGDRFDEVLDEKSIKGDGFLSDLSKQWEDSIEGISLPHSIFRIGIVFDKEGGAFPKLIQSIRYGLNVIFGDGNQYLSWISNDDLSQMFAFAIDHKIEGNYNAVNSSPINYKHLMNEYSNFHNKFSLKILIPIIILRKLLGDFSELFLNSQRVSNQKIKQLGFEFKQDKFQSFLSY